MYNQFKTSINGIKVHFNLRNFNIPQLINLSFYAAGQGVKGDKMNRISTKYALILIKYSSVIFLIY